MTLQEVAHSYVQSIALEEHAGAVSPELAQEAGELRASLHALLMAALREHHIPFVDRADAARLAYQLVQVASSSR